MILKNCFLVSTAVLAFGSHAHADNLPIAGVEYVRICDAFGTGFYYIPGTDTCLRIGGYVRAEAHFVDGDEVDQFYGVPESWVNNWTTRVRGQVSLDARTETDFGLVRAYIAMEGQRGHANITSPVPLPANIIDSTYADRFRLAAGFIEISNDWGTFTAGRRGSFFDFWAPHGYGTRINVDDSTQDLTVFGLTFGFGNGLSATLSAEDPISADRSRRRNGDDDYEGQEAPDGVVNIRLDQGWGSAQVMGAIRHIHDGPDIVPPGPVPGPPVINPGGDGIGFAVGGGLSIGVPMGWKLEGQAGYSEGAIAYVTDDPGLLGDISGLTGDDQTKAVEVRAGIIGPLFNPHIVAWLDGSFTYAEADDGDNYDAWAAKVGARWQPAPGLGMGPEFAFQKLNMNDVGNPGVAEEVPDYEVWGLMWRIQRNF